MSADEGLVADGLAMLGAEFDDTELDQRVTEFRSALRRLRDDPVEAARINELVMDAERAQLDMKTTRGDTGEPILGEAGILDRLIEREKTARRDRIRAGQRALAAMIGFAVITSVTLTFTPHFGVPLVVATSILAGLVAAVAIRTQPPAGGGSRHGDLLLDLARSTLPRPDTPQSPRSGGDDDKPAEPSPSDTTPTVAASMSSPLVTTSWRREGPSRPPRGSADEAPLNPGALDAHLTAEARSRTS